MEPRASGDASVPGPPDHPGVWVPPPLIYVAIFLLALWLHRFLPLPAIPRNIGRFGGPACIAAGLLLSVWSIGLFRRARTSIIPVRPSSALVVGGPYRFTRNPMYLSLLIVYLGAALLTQMLWAVLLSPIVVLGLGRLVIRKEEHYLQRRFGEEFVRYKASVRRWI